MTKSDCLIKKCQISQVLVTNDRNRNAKEKHLSKIFFFPSDSLASLGFLLAGAGWLKRMWMIEMHVNVRFVSFSFLMHIHNHWFIVIGSVIVALHSCDKNELKGNTKQREWRAVCKTVGSTSYKSTHLFAAVYRSHSIMVHWNYLKLHANENIAECILNHLYQQTVAFLLPCWSTKTPSADPHQLTAGLVISCK